jgi:hypothetical protein
VETGTTDEYAFAYGNPNMRAHGQASYNAHNWLQSGGGAMVLRVMPDNALMSHVMFAVQMKVVNDVVTVRPIIMSTPVRSTSLQGLQDELSAVHADSVDGYKTHVLAAFYPRVFEKTARGKAYDEYGVQIRLRSDLDSTYAFRTWDFYVTKANALNVQVIVDGPFTFSLAPEALSTNNESLHLPEIVNTYSRYTGCLFNEAGYDSLGATINALVDPGMLDPFTLIERNVTPAETFHAAARLANVDDVTLAGIVGRSGDMRNGVSNQATASVTAMELALDKLESGSAAYATYATGPSSALVAMNANLGTLPTPLAGTLEDLELSLLAAATQADRDAASKAMIAQFDGSASGPNWLTQYHAAYDSAAILASDIGVIGGLQSIASTLALALVVGDEVKADKALITLAYNDLIKADLNPDPTVVTDTTKIDAVKASLAAVSAAATLDAAISIAADANTNAAVTAAAAAQAALDLVLDASGNVYCTPSSYTLKVQSAVALAKTALTTVLVALETNRVERLYDLAGGDPSNLSSLYNLAKSTLTAIDGAVATAVTASASGPLPALLSAGRAAVATAKATASVALAATYNEDLHNYANPAIFQMGSDGDFDQETNVTKRLNNGWSPSRAKSVEQKLVQAYLGGVDADISNKKLFDVDVLLDANYPDSVKTAMVQLARDIRKDCLAFIDTGFTATPQQALNHRGGTLNMSTFYSALYTQDLTVFDAFTGTDIKVTPTFYLASRIPANDVDHGVQYPLAGVRRGTIDGFKNMSFNPTEAWKERLYLAQINYLEKDKKRTKFGTQLTSQTVTSALSDINNVRVLLLIVRACEELAEPYEFEFSDAQTYSALQQELNGELGKWVANRALTSASATVFASAYDKKRKQGRVRLEVSFNSVIERFLMEFVVK